MEDHMYWRISLTGIQDKLLTHNTSNRVKEREGTEAERVIVNMNHQQRLGGLGLQRQMFSKD